MWVFQSSSVVHYVVDPSRAAEVVIAEFAGVKQGIISCDRYSGYKRFARLNPGIKLAFCWADAPPRQPPTAKRPIEFGAGSAANGQ